MSRPRIAWQHAEDEEIRRIYAMSSAGASSAALKRLAEKKGVKPAHCRTRAAVLGLERVSGAKRRWTEAELENLAAYAGRIPVRRIARILARSDEAIICRLHLLQLSGRVKERGYTRTELADLLGVDLQSTLRGMLLKWPMERNLFGNFAQDEVQVWVWEHLEDLELRKMNQPWLKALLKEAAQ